MKRIKRLSHPVTINNEPSRTDQSQLQSTDVNHIMDLYLKSGDERLLQKRQGQYMDLTEIPDLAQAMSQINLAQDAFLTLPSKLRKQLDNDPTKFIEWIRDPENKDEAIKLGFIKTQPTPEPLIPSQPTPPTSSKKKKENPPSASDDT